ncbi:MAG: class I SAM-dependent methyltransferase [Candidatus Eisenbacteria bacterium]
MRDEFSNVYDDERRADAYAKLEFPGTYYLAFRDLPGVIRRHARGRSAMDFGCGTGRSTRFLRGLGFEVVGVDIAATMLKKARELDPDGDYRLVSGEDLAEFDSASLDLVLSVFTFDNIPTMEGKVALMRSLRRLLRPGGRVVSVVSSPAIYVHEWASFSTRDFPGNRRAGSGDRVLIVMLDVEDARPVEDILWSADDYERVYSRAGLVTLERLEPLASGDEPYEWVSETVVAPWVVYVLGEAGSS